MLETRSVDTTLVTLRGSRTQWSGRELRSQPAYFKSSFPTTRTVTTSKSLHHGHPHFLLLKPRRMEARVSIQTWGGCSEEKLVQSSRGQGSTSIGSRNHFISYLSQLQMPERGGPPVSTEKEEACPKVQIRRPPQALTRTGPGRYRPERRQ